MLMSGKDGVAPSEGAVHVGSMEDETPTQEPRVQKSTPLWQMASFKWGPYFFGGLIKLDAEMYGHFEGFPLW